MLYIFKCCFAPHNRIAQCSQVINTDLNDIPSFKSERWIGYKSRSGAEDSAFWKIILAIEIFDQLF